MSIPTIVFSISDNQTSSHQCSLAMLVCLFILLVYLNPSSVNLDRAVGLCGRCYHSLNHCDCYHQRTTDSRSAALHFSPCGLGIVYAFTLTIYPFKIRKAYTHFCIYCRRLWYACLLSLVQGLRMLSLWIHPLR